MKKIINSSIHNWVNNNRDLLSLYSGKWVAHDEIAVLADAETGAELMRIIEEKNITDYILLYVQPSWFSKTIRFLKLKVFPISKSC